MVEEPDEPKVLFVVPKVCLGLLSLTDNAFELDQILRLGIGPLNFDTRLKAFKAWITIKNIKELK